MSSESEPINVKVSSGGQIYNDFGIWDQFLNGMKIKLLILIFCCVIYKLRLGVHFTVWLVHSIWSGDTALCLVQAKTQCTGMAKETERKRR